VAEAVRVGLRLYDTAARAVREFTPLRAGRVSMYVCGATAQGTAHLGHIRSAVVFDVLRRWLTVRGSDVLCVRNVTDIDDTILRAAAARGRPWWEWAATHERAFEQAHAAVGVLAPSASPRASEHITEMVELTQRLLTAGHAYPAQDGVYFAVAGFPSYGALSGRTPAAGHHGESAGIGQRDPRDFALWTAAEPGGPGWAYLGWVALRPPLRRAGAAVPPPRQRAGAVSRGR